MTVSKSERAGLVDTLNAVGPDAPTLCEGWTAKDLAAHLVLRERRLDAAPGIAFAPLGGYTAKVQDRIAATTSWEDLVEQVASGPPLYSPFRLLDPLVNATEMFVHHEDLRRAVPGWEPRQLDADTQAAVRRPIRMLARTALAKLPVRVVLKTPDGQTLASAGGGDEVVITGEPAELLLWLFGRDAVRVEFAGSDDAVARVRAAKRGV